MRIPVNLPPNSEALAGFDFDGTTHLTSEPAPNGYTVVTAYDDAVRRVFGETAWHQYHQQGGLRNRTPGEITEQLAPNLLPETKLQKTSDLTAAKFDLLLSQVGNRLSNGDYWPRPNLGYRTAWQLLNASETVTTAIVSSGHREFINRVFQVQELLPPDILLTVDDLPAIRGDRPLEKCIKPHRFMLDAVCQGWRQRRPHQIIDSQRLIYAGDDLAKDGVMAHNAGWRFIHVTSTNATTALTSIPSLLGLAA